MAQQGFRGTLRPLQPWHIQRDVEERERPRRTDSHVLLADVFKKSPGKVGRVERGESAGLLLAVLVAGAQDPTGPCEEQPDGQEAQEASVCGL